jgi:tetratricopeptide (TPR) repeat protein
MLATVMLDTGLNAARLAEVIDAAQNRAPDTAGVQVLRMRMAARAGDDATLTTLLQALGKETRHAAIARGAGLALFERVHDEHAGVSLSASQRDTLSAQALEMLDRALAANPDDVEAAWSFGVLSAWLKRDPDLALQRLQRASTLMPENADLARAKFEVNEASGRTGQNLHLLKQIAAFTSSTAERQWAKQRIASETAGLQIPPTN